MIKTAGYIFLGATLLVVGLFAGISVHAHEYQELFPTPRGMSMGGALTAFVDDRSALSYNPAGLALVDGSELRAPDLVMLQYSPDILNVYNQVKGINVSGGGMGAVSALRELDGTAASFGMDLLGFSWIRKHMAFSFQLISMNGAFRVRTPSLFFAKINAKVTADSGLTFGMAQPLFWNHLRLGFALRPFIVRGGFEKQLENQDIATLTSLAKQMGLGWGFDVDVGAQANTNPISVLGLNVKFLAGATMQNIREEDFHRQLKRSMLSSNIPPLVRRGSLAVGAQLDESATVQPTLDVELRDIGVHADSSWIEHLCVGVEFLLKPRTWFRSILRGHFARGEWGGGIAGRLAFGEIEVGTYAPSLGRGPGVGSNRRSYLSLAARW